MNNKFKAQSLNRKSTGNSRCHVLASRALNTSGYFDQSARSIESRCVVINIQEQPMRASQPDLIEKLDLIEELVLIEKPGFHLKLDYRPENWIIGRKTDLSIGNWIIDWLVFRLINWFINWKSGFSCDNMILSI